MVTLLICPVCYCQSSHFPLFLTATILLSQFFLPIQLPQNAIFNRLFPSQIPSPPHLKSQWWHSRSGPPNTVDPPASPSSSLQRYSCPISSFQANYHKMPFSTVSFQAKCSVLIFQENINQSAPSFLIPHQTHHSSITPLK